MRIALVTRRYPPLLGGAEKFLSYLAPALAAEGVQVVVLTAQVAATPPVERTEGGVTVVRLPAPRLRFVGTWRYMASLRGWFLRNRVDLAYVSMLKHDAYMAVDQGRRQGFPVVLRAEGAGATGDLAWQRWGRFGKVIARRCRQADAVVAISPAIRAELLANGYESRRIHEVPNGVPVPEEPWQVPARSGSDPVAIFIGRLAPEKGLDAVVDAWPRVREAVPRARLMLIGEGPLRAELSKQIDRLGLRGAVELPGASRETAGLLRSSDLFVLPSREEGMSVALLEAMALGMPIVATAIPGNQGLISDGVHGRLTPPDNPEALARAIVAVWSDPLGSMIHATAARERIIQEYSIAAVARRHLELFRQLAQDGSRKRTE